jgi:hypothetical protein
MRIRCRIEGVNISKVNNLIADTCMETAIRSRGKFYETFDFFSLFALSINYV